MNWGVWGEPISHSNQAPSKDQNGATTHAVSAWTSRARLEPNRWTIALAVVGLFTHAAGVIDEVVLNLHPVLLGEGTPAVRDASGRVTLDLIVAETIAGGCVYARYRVVH